MISFFKRHFLICLLVGLFPLHFSYAWQIYTAVDEGVHYKLVEKGDKAFLHLFAEQNEARLFLTYEKKGSSFSLVYSFLNADKILFRSGDANCRSRPSVFVDLQMVRRKLKVDISNVQCASLDEGVFQVMFNEKDKILPLSDEQLRDCLRKVPSRQDLEGRIRAWTAGESLNIQQACASMDHHGFYVSRPPTIGLSRELLATQDPALIRPVLREEFLHWLGFEDDKLINNCIVPKCVEGRASDEDLLECVKQNSDFYRSLPTPETMAVVGQSSFGEVAQVPSAVQIAAAQTSSPSTGSSRSLQGQSLLTAAVGAFRGQIAFADAGGAGTRLARASGSQGAGARGPASVGRGAGARAPLRNVTEPRSRSQQNFQASIPSVDATKFDTGSAGRGPASVKDSSSSVRQKREVSSSGSSSSGARAAGRSRSRLVGGSSTGSGGGSGSAFDRLPQGLAASLPPTAEQLIRRLETTLQSFSLDRVEEQLRTLSNDLNEAGITVYTPGDGRRFGAPRGQVWFRIDSEGRLVDVTPRR